MEIKIGQRVLINDDDEGTVVALARVQKYETEALNVYVKVQPDGWFARPKWRRVHEIGVIVEPL